MPAITLITICWNAEKTLARTLESVLAQTRLPAEYRIVDGGSTDVTLALLERYRPRFVEKGVAFSVEAQRRIPGVAGIPGAWNQAIPEASGEVIGLLNADDWYDPPVLQEVSGAFQAEEGLDAVALPVHMHHPDPFEEWLFRPKSLSWLPWKMPVPHPGVFFRKRVYETVGLYDARYRISADYDFIWRCRQAGVTWRYLTPVLVHMQLGGLADSSRALARRETYRIARSHTVFLDFRPLMGWIFRVWMGW